MSLLCSLLSLFYAAGYARSRVLVACAICYMLYGMQSHEHIPYKVKVAVIQPNARTERSTFSISIQAKSESESESAVENREIGIK